jgi:hypothetical protein
MMMLVLAPKPIDEFDENFSNHEMKNQVKIHPKITKMKNIAEQDRR